MKLPTKLRLRITVVDDEGSFLGPDDEPDFDLHKEYALGAEPGDLPGVSARKLSKALLEAADDLRYVAEKGEPIATEPRRDRNSRLN